MAYTEIPTVSAGTVIDPTTYGNVVRTAVNELQDQLPDTAAAWASPVNSGLTTTSGTTTANYTQIGKLVFASFKFVFGASSAVTATITLNLPVTAAATSFVVGSAYGFDTSASAFYPLSISTTASATVTIRAVNTASTNAIEAALSSTVPFTWATGDIITVGLTYLAA